MLWRGALNHRIQAMTSQLPIALLNIAGESLLGFGCRGQLALTSPALTRALGGGSQEPAELPQPEPGNPLDRVDAGTLKVMKREMALALMFIVPRVLPWASM